MKDKRIFLLIMLILLINNLFANDNDSLFYKDSSQNETNIVYAKSDCQHWISSLTFISMFEISLSFYNMVIQKEDYSFIDLDTMYHNLVSPWVWDNDEFYINQLYHPYEGSIYHIIGRANGLSFYEALLTNLYGTLTWEYFMEIDTPAVNDLIITEVTGSYLGEILHKTYHVFEDDCLPLAVIISPFDAFNRLLTGQRSKRANGKISSAYVSGGYSYIKANMFKSSAPDINICNFQNYTYENAKAYNNSSNTYLELDYSYGNRYAHNTKEPLDSFNLNFTTINRDGHFYYSIITDGLFYSKALNSVNDSTLGLIYNFDYLMTSDINYNNNSIGLSFDLQKYFGTSSNNLLNFGISVNFAVNGASEYYDLHSVFKKTDNNGNKQRLYDLGFGPNFKYYFNYKNPLFGHFYLNGFTSCFFTTEFTKPTEGSMGNNFITFLKFGYDHNIYKNLSLGINEIFYYKKGNYETADDITHKMFLTNIYVKYQF